MNLNKINKKYLKKLLFIINDYIKCNKYYGKLIIKIFNFSLYPNHFSVGNYTWKQLMIYDTMIEYKRMIFWFDAGVEFSSSIKYEIVLAEKYDFYMEYNNALLLEWTPNKTSDSLNINRNLLKGKHDGDIGYLLINYKKYMMENVIKKWIKCAYNPMCICPPGSSRNNSRYDQVTFTILLYLDKNYRKTVGSFKSFSNHKKQCDHRRDCILERNVYKIINYTKHCK